MDVHIGCKNHPQEVVSNYCCLLGCQCPLCPECIGDHFKTHEAINSLPEIDTIKHVKQMSKKRMADIKKGLNVFLQHVSGSNSLDMKEVIQFCDTQIDLLQKKL